MGRCSKRGYIDTKASNGRKLRIIYLHDDEKRSADRLKLEIDVLKEFAAAYTRGDGDIKGKTPANNARPAEIILVCSSMHPSTSDKRPHISIEVSSTEFWKQQENLTKSGIHVYSINNSLSEGYEVWYQHGSTKNTKHRSPKIQSDLQQALSNDFTGKSPSPTGKSPPPTPSQQPRVPSPPKQPELAGHTNGWPVYRYEGGYYYVGEDANSHTCGPPAVPTSGLAQPSSSETPSQPGPNGSSSTSSGSRTQSRGTIIVNGIRTPYYYSESQRMYWYWGTDNKKHRYNPPS